MAGRTKEVDKSYVWPPDKTHAVYGTICQDHLGGVAMNDSHTYGPIHINDSSAIIGNNYNVSVTYLDEERRFERFLDSLHHPAMNSRYNSISDATSKTFEWVFDAEISDPSAIALRNWFRSGEQRFLVQGKPGSGKSTFMKFLFQHAETKRLLSGPGDDNQCLLVFHSFWLAGTPLQKNLKGLITSLAFQILLQQPSLFGEWSSLPSNGGTTSAINSRGASYRRCIEDWHGSDLLNLLKFVCEGSPRKLCFFLDGLDEYDAQVDFDVLVGLVKRIALDKHKVCLSTRPNDYILRYFSATTGLRLQDLTENDIQTHVYETLLSKTQYMQQLSVRDLLIRQLTATMCERADGVFLWVYYVLKNVCVGIRNAEDLQDLLKRVCLLPSALVDLYLHMWKSRNDDNQIHREEGAKLLSLARYLPMSVLQYAIAMDSVLCAQYAYSGKCNDQKDLLRACSTFLTRLNARSAGLLEIEGNSTKFKYQDDGRHSEEDIKAMLAETTSMKVKFIHLTVRDFLFDHVDGKRVRESTWSAKQNGEAVALAFVACNPQCLDHTDMVLHRLLTDIARETLAGDPVYALCASFMSRIDQETRSLILYPEDWVYCSYLAHRRLKYPQNDSVWQIREMTVDMQTLIIVTRPDVSTISEYFTCYGREWTPYYRCHLLMESLRFTLSDKAVPMLLNMHDTDWTTPQPSADLHSIFVCRSPLLQLLTQYLGYVLSCPDAHSNPICTRLAPCILRHENHFGERVLSLPIEMCQHNPMTKTGELPCSWYAPEIISGGIGRNRTTIYLVVRLSARLVFNTLVPLMNLSVERKSRVDTVYTTSSTLETSTRVRHSLRSLRYSLFWITRPHEAKARLRFSYPRENDKEQLWDFFINTQPTKQPSKDQRIMFGYDRAISVSQAQFMAKFYPPHVESDVYFMDENTDTPALKLDPFQEINESNWKEHCIMRNYFKEIAEEKQHDKSNALQATPAANNPLGEPVELQSSSVPRRSARKRLRES